MIDNVFHKYSFVSLPKLEDDRGSLSVLEIKRDFSGHASYLTWCSIVSQENMELSKVLQASESNIFVPLKGNLNLQKGNEKLELCKESQGLFVRKSHESDLLKVISDEASLLIVGVDSKLEKEKESLLSGEKKAKGSTIADSRLLNFPLREVSGRSYSVIAKVGGDIPFSVNRVFYIYDAPQKAIRGMHAHRYCHVVLVAVMGSFDVEIDDGSEKKIITLDNPGQGLHIPPGIWSVQTNYSSDAICLALASHEYGEDEYINSYEVFKAYKHVKG